MDYGMVWLSMKRWVTMILLLMASKCFNCRVKHGVFVQSAKLQEAEMSANDILLKAILGGEVVSVNKVTKLLISHLCMCVSLMKSGLKKSDYVAIALGVMPECIIANCNARAGIWRNA